MYLRTANLMGSPTPICLISLCPYEHRTEIYTMGEVKGICTVWGNPPELEQKKTDLTQRVLDSPRNLQDFLQDQQRFKLTTRL
jgi:hypothetical protein